MILLGSASSFDSDALVYINRMGTPPTADRKIAINSLVKALKAGGGWAAWRQICIAQPSKADSLLNLKSNSHDAEEIGTCAFVSDKGWIQPNWDNSGGGQPSHYIKLNVTLGNNSPDPVILPAAGSIFVYQRKDNTDNTEGAIISYSPASDALPSNTERIFMRVYPSDHVTPFFRGQVTADSWCYTKEIHHGDGDPPLFGFWGMGNQVTAGLFTTDLSYCKPNGVYGSFSVGGTYPAEIDEQKSAVLGDALAWGSVPIIQIWDAQYACWGVGSRQTPDSLKGARDAIQSYMEALGTEVASPFTSEGT